MGVVIHPEADEELEAAALWHEERHQGLGDDLLDRGKRMESENSVHTSCRK
jgi:hypothetical protein